MTTLGITPTQKETYVVLAKPTGNTKTMRLLVTSLGTAKSAREALARAEHALMAFPDFRQKWSGWQLFAVLVSDYFEIGGDGTIRHRHEDASEVFG